MTKKKDNKFLVAKFLQERSNLIHENLRLKLHIEALEKKLTLTDVRFELPSDEIFKKDLVDLKNPLYEFYYYQAPDNLKVELSEFRQSLKKALDFLKGN